MKTCKLALLLALTLNLWPSARAEQVQFFRIFGPVASTITAFSADGYMTWTNGPTNATFTVQTASSLLNASNWVDYIQVPSTNPVTTHRIFDPNPPAGMALIPAGSFTMGDSLDGDATALPLHTVYISAFYLDRYEVTKALWDTVYQWATNYGYSFDYGYSGQGKASNHPAQSMTWYDAVKWCNARSEQAGRVPAYYTDAAQANVYRSGQTNVQNDWVKWIRAIGCRRRRSGRRRRGAGRLGGGFHGGTRSRTTKPTITVPRTMPTTSARRGAIIQRLRRAVLPTRVQLAILRRTVMGCMTWPGMYGSGVGIGMKRIRAVRRLIRVAPRQARPACFAGAVGTPTAGTAGRRTAATASRRTGTPSWVSVRSSPQVSKSRNG